jgi:hypothetical protein
MGRLVLVALLLTGCLPASVRPSGPDLIPTYGEVKRYALDLADGYDSRASTNRHALHAGAVAGLLGGLVIAGLSFGTASLGVIPYVALASGGAASLGAIYQHDEKAALYGKGAAYMRAVINESDLRVAFDGGSVSAVHAACLKIAVDAVAAKVEAHVLLLDPARAIAAIRAAPDEEAPRLRALATGNYDDLTPGPGLPLIQCRQPAGLLVR